MTGEWGRVSREAARCERSQTNDLRTKTGERKARTYINQGSLEMFSRMSKVVDRGGFVRTAVEYGSAYALGNESRQGRQ